MATLNYAFKELSCKIVYYGCGLCGKTTNLIHIHKTVPQKFRGELVSLATEQDRTLFFDFLPLDLGQVKGFKTKFQLYTVPGQVYYNATRKLVLRGVDGLVFVVDSQKDRYQENIDSLQNLKQNLAEYGYRLATGPNDFEGIPWVLQYNKRDMPHIMTNEEIHQAVNPDGLPSFESVAVTGQGVKDTLKGISSMVIRKLNADSTSEIGLPSPEKKEAKAVVAVGGDDASKIDDEYGEVNEADLEDDDDAAAAELKISPAVPAAAGVAQGKKAPDSFEPETPATGAEAPVLNVVKTLKARWRGLRMGSAFLTLANLSGGDANVYQLTGRVSFLAFFASTWSRRVRYQGVESREVDGEKVTFFRFTSDDANTPELEIFVQNDFDKSMFVNYLGKMGQVQIVPPGKKPVS